MQVSKCTMTIGVTITKIVSDKFALHGIQRKQKSKWNIGTQNTKSVLFTECCCCCCSTINSILKQTPNKLYIPPFFRWAQAKPTRYGDRIHCCEILQALLKALADIGLLLALDSGDLVMLTILDLSAAFDSVDHDTVLKRMHKSYGQVLNWFASYLCGRVQHVRTSVSQSVERLTGHGSYI